MKLFREHQRTDDYFLSLDNGKKGWFVKTINDILHENEMTVIWESFGILGSQHKIERVPVNGLITISPGMVSNERTIHVLVMGSMGESKLLDIVANSIGSQNKKLSDDLKEKRLEVGMANATKNVAELGRDKGFYERVKKLTNALQKNNKNKDEYGGEDD